MAIDNDILEAISTLTGKTLGDVFYDIEAGNFEQIASEALKFFTKNYQMIERKDDSEPIDDIELLKIVLEDLQVELKTTTDQKTINSLKQDIKNIQNQIQIEKSTEIQIKK